MSQRYHATLTEPFDHVANADKESLLLLLGIRVVIPQIAFTALRERITKVDVDRLRVTNVEEAVGGVNQAPLAWW